MRTDIYNLNDNEVHIWKYSATSLMLQSLIKKASFILSPDELAKASHYVVETSQQEYLAGRLCLRYLLSQYNNSIRPEEWLIVPDSNGKPGIKNKEIRSVLKFNLSHRAGELVFIICKNLSVGIDIEQIKYDESLIKVAQKMFSEIEYRNLLTLSGRHQAEKFFELWTLKESFIKCRGGGLSIPLNMFSFAIKGSFSQDQASPKIVFDPRFIGPDKECKFFSFRTQTGFQVAAAVECTNQLIIKFVDKGSVADCAII